MDGDGQWRCWVLLTQGLQLPWEAAAHCCWTGRSIAETFCPKEQEDTMGRAQRGSWLCLQSPR